MDLEYPELLPQPHDIGPITERILVVEATDRQPGTGIWVHERVLKQRLLTTVLKTTFNRSLGKLPTLRFRLAPDHPFLDAEQKRHLDERGLVRTGTVVHTGDILAAIVAVIHPKEGDPFLPPGSQRVSDDDDTLSLPEEWDGSIVDLVTYESKLGTGLPDILSIALRQEQDLKPGAILCIDATVLGLMTGTFDHADRPDLIVDALSARRLGLAAGERRPMPISNGEPKDENLVEARGTGPYSLISQQPLGTVMAGQSITETHIEFLRERGLHANLAEFCSLKSDDLLNRPRLKALAQEPDATEPGPPESLRQLCHLLRALGLIPELTVHERHLDLRIRPATSAEVIAASNGAVTWAETLHHETYEPIEGGLCCPRIFGSRGIQKRSQFGHLKLFSPIVPKLFRLGATSPLGRAALASGLKMADLEQVVQGYAAIKIGPHGPELRGFKELESDPECQTGGEGIRALLHYLHKNGDTNAHPDILILEALPVLPISMRPIVQLQSGNFATSDLNDLYRSVFLRNSRGAKLKQLGAPTKICQAETRMLQKTCDALMANHLLEQTEYVDADQRPLRDLLDLLQNHFDPKRVDFSARAPVVMDVRLDERLALVPSSIVKTLVLREYQPVLLASEASMAALLPRPSDEQVVRLPPRVFAQLGLHKQSLPFCALHRPLTRAAIEEAERLMRGEVTTNKLAELSRCWIDEDDSELSTEALVKAILSGTPCHLESPRGLLVGGPGIPLEVEARAITSSDDAKVGVLHAPVPDEPETEPKETVIPEPPSRTTATSFDRRARIIEIAEASKRKAVIFTPYEAAAPGPRDALMGGCPRLPEAFPWPQHEGEPLDFIAQIPLDVGRLAGVCPDDLPSGMLLTVFWRTDWWSAPDVRLPIALVPSALSRPRTPPKDGAQAVVLRPEIREEAPTWSELMNLVRLEYGPACDDEFSAFKDEVWPRYTEASPALKLGGCPAWIQSAEENSPLLAQIPSRKDGVMFGDMGALYVFQANEGFQTVLQSY